MRIEEVVKNGLCQGCGACEAAVGGTLISMRLDAEGYMRPYLNDVLDTEAEAAAADVCSGAILEHAPGDKRPFDVLWGPLLEVRTGYAADSEIRFAGSSGGAISALALHVIDSGAADGVLQIRADPNDPLGNIAAYSRTRQDVLTAAGSRYGPASILVGLEERLASGARFAVVGKPCDIAALQRLARRDSRVRRQVVLTISFMCAGVPSRHGTLELLRAMGTREESISSFAYRGEGWPGYARARLRDGGETRMDYTASWGHVLNRHLQFRCKICADGTGEFADVVCADAWYGAEGYPDFTEREGRSLIITRTAAGERELAAAISAGRLLVETLDVEEIAKMQPYQVTRKRNAAVRLCGVVLAGGAIPTYRRMGLLRAMVQERPTALIKSFVGTFLRVFKMRRPIGRGARTI
jgi:coenzyme F420 hydrogenase subunit beta